MPPRTHGSPPNGGRGAEPPSPAEPGHDRTPDEAAHRRGPDGGRARPGAQGPPPREPDRWRVPAAGPEPAAFRRAVDGRRTDGGREAAAEHRTGPGEDVSEGRTHRRCGTPPEDEDGRRAPSAPAADGGGEDLGPAGAGADGHGRDPGPAGAGGAGQRVGAPRRFSAAARRSRWARLTVCAGLLAVAMTAGAVAVEGGRDEGRAGAAGAAPVVAAGALAGGDLGAGIRSLQAHLRAQPRDFGGWATLGTAYVEQARTQGDPSRYPQAERALERSLALAPGNERALAGRAALAAARHDFTGALAYADRALEQNPHSERALCSRIDALVELGRYEEAADAAATADRRRPGVPVFTRYAYVRELRGDVRTAREVLRRALDGASSPADVAYVATALGQLAWNQGEYEAALTHYARALAADDGYLPALEGRARAQAAGGDRAGAVKTLEQVVVRSPLPGPLVALGELYEERGADGDRAKARDQYALVDAWTALARAGGVDADLDTALAAADHGDAGEALRAARAEWDRRHSVHTADALAWALHVNGRDEEALPYARRATATGYRDAAFLYHRGVIEKATGHDRAARRSLTAALELNPGFSPPGARAARAALKELEAAR
ncbi:tetratricopeptide repeat protein [Streptomyces caelestis]|uniref:Tetratricopeptide repeat protein n=1 Tax=Streptomyces caelestis TaxID=36816 RepID=A0A0M9XB78_9ACTN|nr:MULTISPECIES: tetratricopeptide repeat protein [Streptomyces]KOT46493.1 tetratricopeptide repeat protein [Streptomyces caelestis]